MALVVLMGLVGCATGNAVHEPGAYRRGRLGELRQDRAPDNAPRAGSGGTVFDLFGEKKDEFQVLQEAAGLEAGARHEAGEELEVEDAQALWESLARTQASVKHFGPRRTLVVLLRQVLTTGEDVSYEELVQRTQRFRFLVVMRPDGYLTGTLSGRPLQGMGRLVLREGRLMAGPYEVGAFYRDRGGVFHAVDEALQLLPQPAVGELALERDWFNAALDGAEDALEEMVVGLAGLVTDPIRGVEGLAQLPSAVAGLLLSSPEYFARYGTRPLQEQIREAARLSTHLVMLYGSAAGASTRVSTAGAKLPVLALNAEGVLTIEQVAVPGGSTAAVLGTGAGAVYVLMGSEKAPKKGGASSAAGGPGEWKHKKFSGSERARRYQEQITGRSADELYYIERVEYDGFRQGVLKEAKAPGYLKLFEKGGQPEYWYRNSGEFQGLLNQAKRQSEARRGLPVEWHVAEQEMVDILRYHFRRERISGIEVLYTPPVP
ncbi:Tox-REase-5 domain-containing protein [Hyalangium rubrum]|uniref:Tox-REase-5 domain-containing protein n=1 Tax=Hyalangium rubrum TaxID=3103134 RepID=A0ABU5GZJ5_9BACT|nr:Tox-REase-5 domain-containing protein [Hyalangium sp. s54d21]MDY7225958.1 Tox-REase-5 domain-containing protein [Hyalangium sp. s54d21]